jgi:hypothetical protein
MTADYRTALVVASLAGFALSGCSASSETRGPVGCSGPQRCESPIQTNSPHGAALSPDVVVLDNYLDAVQRGDCSAAERLVHQPAPGDLCAGGHLGAFRFAAWRNPSGLPTPSCCVAYAVELQVSHELGDATLPRWESRAFTLRPIAGHYWVSGVGTTNRR